MFFIIQCALSLGLTISVNAFTTIPISQIPTSTTITSSLHLLVTHQIQNPKQSTTTSIRSTLSQVVSDDDTAAVYEQLSLPARNGRPLKVAIAGGGVGGLTTALCLLKKGIDVTVYEKTAAFARFGGPIQFASNALSVLKEIDDTLFNRIMEKFTFTGTRTCGIKDGLRADGSFRMTNDSLDYLWNPDAPADWFVKFPLKVIFYCFYRCIGLFLALLHLSDKTHRSFFVSIYQIRIGMR